MTLLARLRALLSRPKGGFGGKVKAPRRRLDFHLSDEQREDLILALDDVGNALTTVALAAQAITSADSCSSDPGPELNYDPGGGCDW